MDAAFWDFTLGVLQAGQQGIEVSGEPAHRLLFLTLVSLRKVLKPEFFFEKRPGSLDPTDYELLFWVPSILIEVA